MNMNKIIKELIHEGIIQAETTRYGKLKGGTSSEAYLLQNSDHTRYVIKSNKPEVIKAEASFLYAYQHLGMTPNLLYVEPVYRYIIYTFISGAINEASLNKKHLLQALIEKFINHYKKVSIEECFGCVDERTESWIHFLWNEIMEVHKVVNPYLAKKEHDYVWEVFDILKNNYIEKEPFLLHGDCGVHNFIYEDNRLKGVIDPTPVIGYPLYDVIYAFCSSPEDLTKETIDAAISYLTTITEKEYTFLYEQVLIGLYLRLGSCIKHHPTDLEEYLKAWFYWKEIINSRT